MSANKFTELKKLLSQRTVVKDGAMGTMLQSYNLCEDDYKRHRFSSHEYNLSGNFDVLSLSRPEIIKEIHTKYIEAGADIITTNSFNSNSISQETYQTGSFSYEINYHSALLAKEVADSFDTREIYVAGSVGPTTLNLSNIPEDEFEIAYEKVTSSYYDSIRGLLDGGVDILLVETVIDMNNLLAFLEAFEKIIKERDVTHLPLWVSFTPTNKDGTLLSGESIESAVKLVSEHDPFCIGLNCGTNIDMTSHKIKEVRLSSDCLISFHPAADKKYNSPKSFAKIKITTKLK